MNVCIVEEELYAMIVTRIMRMNDWRELGKLGSLPKSRIEFINAYFTHTDAEISVI